MNHCAREQVLPNRRDWRKVRRDHSFRRRSEIQDRPESIRHRLPVEEYLRPQKRFAHLFGKTPAYATIARIQGMADKNIRKYGLRFMGGA